MTVPPDPVSRETALRTYHTLLLKWQEKINLISPTTAKSAWERHFQDSLQISPLIPDGAIVYDLGSGGGFPGMVLAMWRPDLSVTLIESDAKKCAFLAAVSRETGAPATLVNKRIETAQDLAAPDFITARALASLENLLDLCSQWLDQSASIKLILLKGAGWRREVEAAKGAGWAFDLEALPSETDPEARILLLKNVRKNSALPESA